MGESGLFSIATTGHAVFSKPLAQILQPPVDHKVELGIVARLIHAGVATSARVALACDKNGQSPLLKCNNPNTMPPYFAGNPSRMTLLRWLRANAVLMVILAVALGLRLAAGAWWQSR